MRGSLNFSSVTFTGKNKNVLSQCYRKVYEWKTIGYFWQIKTLLMTPKNFFRIVLKIFSLFFIFSFVALIPQIFSAFGFIFQSGFNDVGTIVEITLWIIIIIAFYGYAIYLLLFRTDKIVNLLKLDQGFDQETFSFEISKRSILTIGVIIVGGVILVGEIPNLCSLLYKYFQYKNLVGTGYLAQDWPPVISSGVKIIIGLLLLGERKRIVDLMVGKQSSEQTEGEGEN